MKSKTIRRWSFIHTWTSLICTAFLLMLALTGLPLIFHHEIDHLLGDAPELRQMPEGTPHLNLQQLVKAAEAHRPRLRYVAPWAQGAMVRLARIFGA